MIWHLTAKSGPRRGESWAIGERPITLGRGLNCEIHIQDPTVSRQHCQVYLEGNEVVFRDLGSRNVSLVNGTVVTEGRLALGDELSVGSSAFILTRTVSSENTAQNGDDPPPSTVSLRKAMLPPDALDQTPAYRSFPSTAHDVFRMFQFGRRLSRASCEEAFASACVREMEGLFPEGVTVALWCGNESDYQWYPATFEASDEIVAQVNAAMATGRPSLERHRRKGRLFQDQLLACAAPLMVSGHCRGALLATSAARRYVLKDSDLERLDGIAQAAAPFQVWRYAPARDHDQEKALDHLELIGEGASGNLRREILSVSSSGHYALITGENNAAVALAARLIHDRSQAPRKAYVWADCNSLAGPGFFRELAGADGSHPGLLEQAEGGTLVLANIEALTDRNQADLLDVAMRGSYRRAGERNKRAFIGRIVATSSHDPDALRRDGRLRGDLLALLGRQHVRISPLAYVQYARAAGDPADTPTGDTPSPDGISAAGSDGRIGGSALETREKIARALYRKGVKPPNTDSPAPRPREYHDSSFDALAQAEETLIRAVLSQCNGDLERAAKVFGIPLSELRPLVEQLNEAPGPSG